MELALYCPDYGFYEKERDNLGARGHFYTSVSVGPLFGELLAIQFAEWFEADATSVPGQNQSSQTATSEKLSGARDVPARTSHDAGGATKVFQDALTVVSAAGRDVPRSGSS